MIAIYIYIKTLIGKLTGKIGNVEKEIDYVKKFFKKQLKTGLLQYKDGKILGTDIKYKAETLDNQQDSIHAIEHNDDCDGLHRIAQVFYYIKGYKIYLMSCLASPLKRSHATCIGIQDGKIYLFDYNSNLYYETMEDIIEHLENIYDCEIKGYVLQDINWKIVK